MVRRCLGYLILSLGPSYTLKLMVSQGSITYYGTGLLAFADGNVNSQKYIDTIEHYLWPVITKHFSNQHWYSVHRSALTEAWKQANNLPTFFWSPHWECMVAFEKLCEKEYLKNQDRQWLDGTELLRGWNKLPVTYLQSLYSTLPRRCRQVLRSKGYITKQCFS